MKSKTVCLFYDYTTAWITIYLNIPSGDILTIGISLKILLFASIMKLNNIKYIKNINCN